MYLTYTAEAMQAYDLGIPLLSQRFPLTDQRYANDAVRAFLDGLLPEEEQRRLIAQDLDIKASDTYTLIEAIGRDCAGAIVILPEGQSLADADAKRITEPLTERELSNLIANLRESPLGISDGVRLSLAGAQEKLVLTRAAGGSWVRPSAATPSTHILKPDNARYPNIVENEAFCMRLARNLGIPVANVETMRVGERKLLVVERFDRATSKAGVRRVHQEDLCQGLGLSPAKKYEEYGGPSLRTIARFLDDVAGPEAVVTLARIVVLNVLIGNCDAHAKNLSLLYKEPGIAGLAPAYDLLSSELYGERKLAMYIDSVRKIEDVRADRLINEVAGWGVSVARARDTLGELLGRAKSAASAAARETDAVPGELLRLCERRLATLQDDG